MVDSPIGKLIRKKLVEIKENYNADDEDLIIILVDMIRKRG